MTFTMGPRPVLFLDLDDVLIVPSLYKIKNKRRVRDGRKVHYAFLPQARDFLLEILRKSDAFVVLSSTWREEGRREVDTVLGLNGCSEVSDSFHSDWATDVSFSKDERRDEIARWIDRHPEVARFAAIDNDPSIASESWAVSVNPETGLTDANAAAAITLLVDPRPAGNDYA